MRKNDFFKYLLLGGGGSESRVELESEILPYAFNSNSYKLRNYRIYGAEGGVGDSVSSGEHSGEYLVPVTIEGKNLLQNTATSQTINGVTFTVNDDGGITCNGTAEQTIFLSINNYIRIVGNVILSGCPDGGGSDSYMLRINSSGTITAKDQGSGANVINPLGMVEIRIASGYTCNNVTFYPMIRRAAIADNSYELYRAPVITNIYLPEPIGVSGNNDEYIDYSEQKQHFADGTSQNIKIPALPITAGINTLSIGTTVQPSKIWIQGNISEIETVSVQALQANMQSLQPLSFDDEDLEIDVMPTDNDLQLDVKPIEKPVLNLNNVSEIENAEIERGVENAE